MDQAPRLDRIALVVDDDTFVASALAELLGEDGYTVHQASNGFSAVRLAVELRPAVVLLDLALPERSGQEVLGDLRADPATRDLAVIVVTGHPEGVSDSLLTELDGLVIKPFDTDQVLAAVHRAVQHVSGRWASVAPVAATTHREAGPRVRKSAAGRRARGR
ncbi:MAG TPA: response regulator, partial [Chloroflexota bacterium]